MFQRDPHHSRGQVLILVAVGMVVLMAVAAIVIDLGFSWMLHRKEQNAADPGAIAAARWLRDAAGNPTNPVTVQGEMNAEACFYAQQNGFFVGDPNCANALTSGDLQVHAPPVSGPFAAQSGHVQVIIRDSHPVFFARIWGQAQAVVVTAAVAANTAGNSNSSSLVALQPVCEGGSAGTVTGGGTVKIFPITPGADGGYVRVNSPCGTSNDDICQNGVGASALAVSGGGTLIAPYASVVGSCVFNGTSGTNPNPPGFYCDETLTTSDCLNEYALPPLADPLATMPRPHLDAFPNGVCPGGTLSTPSSTSGCQLRRGPNCPNDGSNDVCHLTPGVYYGGWSVGSRVRLELEPGLYILAGGGIQLAGSDASIEAVTSPDQSIEARITIFSTDGPGCPTISAQCQDKITFTANQAFKAKATNATSCQAIIAAGGPNTCPWKGILLWQDGTASNPTATIKLGGQSSTILAGTIYAPLADVAINGGQTTTGCGAGPSAGCLAIQIISYTWKIDGGALVEMPYDPSELYVLDQRGLVH